MNFIEAWTEIANWWRKPIQIVWCGKLSYVIESKVGRIFGLCESVSHLYGQQLISRQTREKMLLDIEKERDNLEDGGRIYFWPHDEEGTLARVGFCERMVEKYKEGKVE